ncbi:DUF4190 domain-containing protein [Rathayibacter agropyri]|uniref:DUF4190 domain-containing protein n=1 Tax=Rathayibacter agropyri TaxID=1634927 RepID=UPI0015665266|nr:DUF4190 domain-containing protein [Rathayibacter agropyri]NRD09881.1 DUF4190 domain-containing protein [Rathayibacter agropyri]
MSTDDRTARLSTAADEHPTEDVGTTAVLTDARPHAEPATAYLPPRPDYGAPPVPPAALAPAPSTPFSLTSLILGVTSIFFGLTVVAPAAGLVFGILGLRREPTGRTLAIWGIVLNGVMLGIVLLFAVAFVALLLLAPFLSMLR